MKKLLAGFLVISASVFCVEITNTALISNNSNKSINLQDIRSYNDYYMINSSANNRWGESVSDEDDKFWEEWYKVCLHLNNQRLENKNSSEKQQESEQKYLNWIKELESKDINSLKNLVSDCKNDEIPLLILIKYGSKLSQKELFSLTQALLSDEKVKKKIKLNAKNSKGETPLLFAAKNNYEEIFKLLVNNGAGANETLSMLIQNDQNDLAKWLIDQKALQRIKLNLNTKNSNGDTSLHTAAKNGNEEIFDLLVDIGANINAKNKDGQTAREIAVLKRFKNYVEKLPEKKIKKKSKNEIKPIDITSVVVVNGDKDYSKKIATHEKSLLGRIKQDKNSVSLFDAIGIDSLKIVKYLVEKCDADVNKENIGGLSSLHYAVVLNRERIAKYLIDHGANIDQQDKREDTALHIAAKMELDNMVKLLVENKADVNIENEEGDTPLSIAVRKRNKVIARYLIEYGIN